MRFVLAISHELLNGFIRINYHITLDKYETRLNFTRTMINYGQGHSEVNVRFFLAMSHELPNGFSLEFILISLAIRTIDA